MPSPTLTITVRKKDALQSLRKGRWDRRGGGQVLTVFGTRARATCLDPKKLFNEMVDSLQDGERKYTIILR